ncbi:hypothetical protein Tco_0648289 [Tanacetum coccineum]
MELVLEQTQQGTSYEVSVSAEGVEELKRKVKIKGEKKEALLTLRQKPEHVEFDESDTHVLERLNTSAGNPVKEILLKLNLPDHRIIKDGCEVSVTSATPSSDTIIPQTPILIIQTQQQTHDSTTTTTIPATTLPNIPNFTSLFGFKRRVSSLEIELYELKQTNQFAEVVSSIPGIVDNYLASKMKDEVNVAIQLQSNKLREEAQVENEEFLNQIDSNIKAIIKDQVKAQVKAQVSKILPKVEKFVTESLRADVLARSWSSLVTNIWKRLMFEGRTIGFQGKLTNLNLDERFALNVALRMYTRRIIIQERMEDLQLAVESYQKKINLSRSDSYRSDLRNMTPYTTYPNIQGIIYQDDMDINRLMRTDELHKFSNDTLYHVRTALNDIATWIQMDYLPKKNDQTKKRRELGDD